MKQLLLLSTLAVMCWGCGNSQKEVNTKEDRIKSTIENNETTTKSKIDICQCLTSSKEAELENDMRKRCVDSLSLLLGVPYTDTLQTNTFAGRKLDSLLIDCGLKEIEFTKDDADIFAEAHFANIEAVIIESDTMTFGGKPLFLYLTSMNNNKPDRDGKYYYCMSYIGGKSGSKKLEVLMTYCQSKSIIQTYWKQPLGTLRALIDKRL